MLLDFVARTSASQRVHDINLRAAEDTAGAPPFRQRQKQAYRPVPTPARLYAISFVAQVQYTSFDVESLVRMRNLPFDMPLFLGRGLRSRRQRGRA
jgi:hypothetical protein